MKKVTQKSILLLLALIVAFSGFGFTSQPAKSAKCAYYHTVWYGETLYKIGLQYGMTWDKIASANNINKRGTIYAGEVLCIPTAKTYYGTGGPYNYNYYGYGGAYNNYNYYGYGGQYANYDYYGTGGAYNYDYYYGTPYITVTSVNEGKTVTIKGYNFPKKSKFLVYMGNYGYAGTGGVKVSSFSTGKKTTFTATFDIPASLKNKSRIAITVKNKSTGVYAYSWFNN